MSDINVPGLYTSPSPGQSPYYGNDDGGGGGYGAEGAGAAGAGGGGGGRRESLGMGRRSVSGGSGSGGSGSVGRVAKQKVTSVATEVASNSRRTNNGIFQCPGKSPPLSHHSRPAPYSHPIQTLQKDRSAFITRFKR